ncbi:CopG family transcriptional regulator [Bacillus sp. EB01]|uniref:ribbon-helix-helix domain-containing protein n=1 Tax=Bacillus sp. EB01 TaxID=1347086 RepID=UPI0005C68593|nr:CopG family transcriptional regulator [Bacillus sp. EB01]
MDILNEINSYIKTTTNEEKLCEELIALLNKGYDFQHVASLYDFDENDMEKTLKKNNYFFSQNNWTKSLHTTNTIESKIKLDEDLFLLNNDTSSLDLIKNGYHYYMFLNRWSKLTEEEILNYIVEHYLNSNFTLYDISSLFVKNFKDRYHFVNKIEQLLNQYRYSYNEKSKKWLPSGLLEHDNNPIEMKYKINENNIKEIVKELNSGLSMKHVVQKYKTDAASLRLLLKQYEYRFDPLFLKWTNKKRIVILEKLASDLCAGKTTLNDLRKKGLNIKIIEKELKNSGFRYEQEVIADSNNIGKPNPTSDIISKDYNLTINKNETDINLNKSGITESKNLEIIEKYTEELSTEEIESLRKIIKEWQMFNQNKTGDMNEIVKVSVYLPKELLILVDDKAEEEDVSKSRIISKALTQFLK